MEGGAVVVVGCAEGEEVLRDNDGGLGQLEDGLAGSCQLAPGCAKGEGGWRGREVRLTSAVLGTLSQKTSILMSPSVVCNVTDMVRVLLRRRRRRRRSDVFLHGARRRKDGAVRVEKSLSGPCRISNM